MGSTPEAAQVREAMETVASFAQFEVQLLGEWPRKLWAAVRRTASCLNLSCGRAWRPRASEL